MGAVFLAFALFATGRFANAQPVVPPSPLPASSPVAPAALPAAGKIPATLTLDITGSPGADAAFLDEQIRAALDRAIRPTLRPGASIAYGPIVPWPLLPLVTGERAAVNVTVTITGDDVSAPLQGVTLIVLNSETVPRAEPAVLFLSDDPEYLLGEGMIYRGDVTVDRAARLYYYHSDIGLPRDLDIVLTANAPSRVHLIGSAAGPDLDVMAVGHAVSRDYLRYRENGEGTVTNLVPGKAFVVRHALLLQGEVVAGVVDVRVLSGGPVAASVVASPAGGRPEAYLAGPRVAFDGHHRHGAFDVSSYGTIAASYAVGGEPKSVQYGGRSPTPQNLDPRDDGHDYGDYGVARRVTFALANTTDVSRLVYFYEKPLGGPVRSSFVIDGQLKEIGCARLPQRYGIMTYQLPPHSSGASTIVTMTDGGSFYPLELGITETPPLPDTPAIGASDGCSPNPPPGAGA
jgi:hypothetical protein